MSAIYDRFVDYLRRLYDWRISAPAILSLEPDFPTGARFVEAWPALREEALRLAERVHAVPRFHEIMPEQESISANDGRDWRMFIMKAYGRELPRNMALCPCLAAIVRADPDVLSASFSILGPHKHIPAHRGPLRGILRFYLVLVMPQHKSGDPAAVLRIAGQDYRLNEGQFLLWDDTFEHEAWNESGETRFVLSLDVRRKFMPFDMKILSAAAVAIIRTGMILRDFGEKAGLAEP